MRIATLLLVSLVACGKSSSQGSDKDGAAAGSGSAGAAAPASCAKLDAPVKALFARMEAHIGAIEVAFRDAGTDCKKLEAGLTALDTPGYMAAMKAVALEMKPNMTPACEAHLDKLGSTGEFSYKPRFEKLLVEAKAANDRCTEPSVRAAIQAALKTFKRKRN